MLNVQKNGINQWQQLPIHYYKLCCDKALHILEWVPVMNFEETIQYTVDWYRNYYEGPNKEVYKFTNKQIESYIKLASKRKIVWTI